MQKRYLFALFSFIIIFLLSGCGQESLETKDIAQRKENLTEKSLPTENDETPSTEENEAVPTDLTELTVHFIDVGQGDSTLLQFSDDGEDFTILIDAGNWTGDEVVQYLKLQHVSQIDIAVGTHPDADHIGQLDQVINTFNVGEVWLSGNTNPSQTFQRLLKAIDSKVVDYYEPRMGDQFEIGPLKIDVLYPKTISEHDNEESISLKLTYGEVTFILTGDATTEDELNMLQSGIDMKADILKLGHHGSSTSTHPTFLREVDPDVAIYSAGLNNTYGHPHDEVINLVQNSKIQLYGTDVHGTVLVETDGKDYQILTKNAGTITPSSSGKTPKEEAEVEPAPIVDQCIDVNSASLEQLQEIIHIGAARAQDLIKLRPFTSVDDLGRMKGIGPARIADIKSQGLACAGG
ncbi:MBL fold metallo-hydrolase [Bacillus sp. EB106-08-02-XG196]|uniref:MBL fold metallo-hydrolase n=1 Tax=Bacillus sp. EB106-08-02-XG196 TaxID=2737049 RepID=UPI0015C49353|nr:MBL fold metallo-hydrolase [Bacillus sp. EB106-08-02-XG196]NWQ44033.1 MBL fold metallo-hydrolase [Bacillus sp. EB106-08-02-XG196]